MRAEGPEDPEVTQVEARLIRMRAGARKCRLCETWVQRSSGPGGTLQDGMDAHQRVVHGIWR